MPTTKKRIYVTLSADAELAIARLAKRDNVPEATKTGELVRAALELQEDSVLDTLASQRDTPRARFVSNKDIWK